MSELTKSIETTFGITPEIQTKILYSVLILVVLGVIRFAILKIVWRITEDPKSRHTWKRSVSFIVGVLMMVLIGSVWIRAMGQFGAFLGLLTAGLAIALKDPLTNIAGWIFIFRSSAKSSLVSACSTALLMSTPKRASYCPGFESL